MNTDTAITRLGGFECLVDLPAEVSTLMQTTYIPGSLNFLTPPQFLVGADIPVLGSQVLLATFVVYIVEDPTDQMWGAFVKPVESRYQSIEGFAAITDYDDEFSLSIAPSAGGTYDDPVFFFIPSGDIVPGSPGKCVVDTESQSWGNLKALYR